MLHGAVARDAAYFTELHGHRPCLATVLAGDDPASHTYVRMKRNRCAEVGMDADGVTMHSFAAMSFGEKGSIPARPTGFFASSMPTTSRSPVDGRRPMTIAVLLAQTLAAAESVHSGWRHTGPGPRRRAPLDRAYSLRSCTDPVLSGRWRSACMTMLCLPPVRKSFSGGGFRGDAATLR
ncbi:tetrahydrofolate dehydrogenase/cyclohydrolase catalytic domain-containing protein [Rhodococcus sp. NPDC060090]|uniref:tetrahydrofolate dehydrogenase/cyclohydrolase catalytic domain-containing protein n=1 Tax=Rhodococcus sp. NPDC060090 TaxID=3347056 RepID=UPI003661F637